MAVKRSGPGGTPASGTGWAAGEEGAPEPQQSEIPESHISTPELRAVTLRMTSGILAQLKTTVELTQERLRVADPAPHGLHYVKLRVARYVSEGSPQAVFACLASIRL